MMKSGNFLDAKGAAQPEPWGRAQELYNSKSASAESACRTESRFQRSCLFISSILGRCPRLANETRLRR